MPLNIKKIRTIAIASVTTVVVLSVGWWGAWSIAASQYRHVIDGWIEAGKAQGYQISYGDRSLFGFPRHVVLRFTNVEWKDNNNVLFHADDIDIAALPWRWDVFDAKFKKHVQITAPMDETHALVLGGEDGRARVALDKDGFWRYSRVSLNNASFGQTPNFLVTATSLKAEAARPEEEPKGHKDVGLTLKAEAENVMLPTAMPSPFGLQMPEFAVDMRVMGPAPDFRKRSAVDAWNKDMGVVEFDNLHMNWGPLKLAARGTMGFDDDLQPEGAFSSAIGDSSAVLKALM
ncbi:MAG TPA: DUF2125 domain-containing protein, partial [Alphaproteobacteria bacterium]|nr:DUF2125 domain-containing protein [Alphaproteobacteria bacterium]